jgi:hypothetical protein
LLLALAVAVPAQGISAVTAGFCMAMGHHKGHGADVRHAHEAPYHDHAAMEAEAADESSSSHKPAGSGHCPPCVSCCAVTAIAPTPQLGLPDAPPAAAIAVLHDSVPGFLPERLDRPPLAL